MSTLVTSLGASGLASAWGVKRTVTSRVSSPGGSSTGSTVGAVTAKSAPAAEMDEIVAGQTPTFRSTAVRSEKQPNVPVVSTTVVGKE